MFWYFVFAAILFLLNIMENGGRRHAGAAAALLLAVVAGSRYETGFDWVEYEFLYFLAPKIGQPDIYQNVDYIAVEKGWQALSSILKTFGFGFQGLLAVVAAFNIWVLFSFSRKYSHFTVVVLIWYYGFCFLSGQMAAIRSCAGISFILIGFMCLDRGKPYWALLAAATSITFHAFSLVLAPFIFLNRRLPPWQLVIALTLPALALIVFFDISIFALVVQTLGSFLPTGLVTAKLELYGDSTGARFSPFLLILLGWHVLAYILIVGGERSSEKPRVLRLAGYFTILNIVAHCYFPDYPVFWNRVMLMSFFVQAVALANIYRSLMADPPARAVVGAGATAIACGSLYYSLSSIQAIAFTPYQSSLVTTFRGDYGDGRLRYSIVRKEIDTAAAESRAAAGVN